MAVIVTQDRKSTLDLTVATMGRLKKVDIENAESADYKIQTFRIKPKPRVKAS